MDQRTKIQGRRGVRQQEHAPRPGMWRDPRTTNWAPQALAQAAPQHRHHHQQLLRSSSPALARAKMAYLFGAARFLRRRMPRLLRVLAPATPIASSSIKVHVNHDGQEPLEVTRMHCELALNLMSLRARAYVERRSEDRPPSSDRPPPRGQLLGRARRQDQVPALRVHQTL